jgi:regulatory protein
LTATDVQKVKATTKLDADPYLVALRLLAGRDYTVTAITRKLLIRGCDEGQVVSVVDRLVADRFLDDRRYGERFVAAVRESGRFAGYRLHQELHRRGVPSDLIKDLLQEKTDVSEEFTCARDLVVRRYTGFDPKTADERERRRVAGFLQRRGYRSEVIRRLFDKNGSLFEDESVSQEEDAGA